MLYVNTAKKKATSRAHILKCMVSLSSSKLSDKKLGQTMQATITDGVSQAAKTQSFGGEDLKNFIGE